jgi:hypothetical protein
MFALHNSVAFMIKNCIIEPLDVVDKPAWRNGGAPDFYFHSWVSGGCGFESRGGFCFLFLFGFAQLIPPCAPSISEPRDIIKSDTPSN